MTKELCPQCGTELAKPQAVSGVGPAISQEEADQSFQRAVEAQERPRTKIKEMGDKQRRAGEENPWWLIRFTI